MMPAMTDDTTMIAVHEAGHAVVARALTVGVLDIAWPPSTDGRSVVTTGGAYRLAVNLNADLPTRLAALEDDCKIMLGGPLSEVRFASLNGLALNYRRAWDREWRDDRQSLARAIVKAVDLKHGGTLDIAELVDQQARTELRFIGEHADAANEMRSRVTAATAELVKQHWAAIESVAAALLRDGSLSPDWLDVLIADAPAKSSLVEARPEELRHRRRSRWQVLT